MSGRMKVGHSKLIAPNLEFLPGEWRNGVRRFHIIAEEVQQELTNGVTVRAWGYNGSSPGPVMVAQEGDLVQVVIHNKLPERTSIHWHGVIVPNQVDGVPEIGAGNFTDPGNELVLEFPLRQSGTYMYHAHVMDAKQVMMGLSRMLVALPRVPTALADREFIVMLQEWAVRHGGQSYRTESNRPDSTAGFQPGIYDINPLSMDFNYFTINGKAYPDTAPLRVRPGERVRIRMGNLSMNAHPMHLHGHTFNVVSSDGSSLPMPVHKDTINVAPGETWDIEFVADNPGVWAYHCHKPHHISNAHQASLGGMFTVVQYV